MRSDGTVTVAGGAATLLAHFDAQARDAREAEAELRKSLAKQIAQMERQRTFAFRRSRLIRALATSVPPPETEEPTPDAGWAAQKHAVCEELGWTELSDSHRGILALMESLAADIQRYVHAPDEARAASVTATLADFEAAFEAAHAKPFYVLFDQYVPEVPVVDF